MNRTVRMLMVAGMCCLTVELSGDEASAKKDLEMVLKRYDTLFQQKFQVNVKCPEVSAILKKKIAQATEAMFGFPLQVDIDYFILSYDRGKCQVRASLANVPPAQKKQMEQQANQLLQGSPVGSLVKGLAYDALRKGTVYLKDNKERCKLQKETDEVIDFLVNGEGQQVMQGLTLKNGWFRIDRKQKVIYGIKFTFSNDTSMLIRMKYREVPLPGKKVVVPVLTKLTIKQDALRKVEKETELPAQLSVVYSAFKFASQ